jgi:hypothetical protein
VVDGKRDGYRRGRGKRRERSRFDWRIVRLTMGSTVCRTCSPRRNVID